MNMQGSIFFALTICVWFAALARCETDNNEIDDEPSSGSSGRWPSHAPARPMMRCVSGGDCGRNECSVMGMQRYAEPRCEPLGRLGAPCRPGAQPDNKTLAFPHATMECTNVHMQFCPCASGLVCGPDAECIAAAPVSQKRQAGQRFGAARVLGAARGGSSSSSWLSQVPEMEALDQERYLDEQQYIQQQQQQYPSLAAQIPSQIPEQQTPLYTPPLPAMRPANKQMPEPGLVPDWNQQQHWMRVHDPWVAKFFH